MPRPRPRRPSRDPLGDRAARDRLIQAWSAELQATYGEHAWMWARAPREVWLDPAAHAAWADRVAKAAAVPGGLRALADARSREEATP